jgi:hypothetical protein
MINPIIVLTAQSIHDVELVVKKEKEKKPMYLAQIVPESLFAENTPPAT